MDKDSQKEIYAAYLKAVKEREKKEKDLVEVPFMPQPFLAERAVGLRHLFHEN